MSQLILYDLPTKDPRVCWSYNPWKSKFFSLSHFLSDPIPARLVLNFKKLDYKTIWTEYPDIEPTLRDHLPPLEGERAYTIPTMQFPDGTYVMDSQNLAERIEKDHPEPPLHLDSPLLEQVNDFGPKIMAIIRPMVIAGVYANLLPEKSRGYFEKHGRVKQLPEEQEQEELWTQASPGIKELGELLRANGGPFLMCKTRKCSMI